MVHSAGSGGTPDFMRIIGISHRCGWLNDDDPVNLLYTEIEEEVFINRIKGVLPRILINRDGQDEHDMKISCISS